MFHVARDVDRALGLCALLDLRVSNQPSLAGRVANNDATLLEALDVALVVAANAITYRHEGEVVFVEYVATFGSQFKHTLGELVVVLLLLDGVVKGRVAEILLPVGNKELL